MGRVEIETYHPTFPNMDSGQNLPIEVSIWEAHPKLDIVFVVRKAIKGQAIADYLADQPLNDLDFSESFFPDEDVLVIEPKPSNVESWCWKLYFKGAINSIENEVGAVLVSSKGQQILVSVKLNFDCTNDVTEYEECIVGLQVGLEFGACSLHSAIDHHVRSLVQALEEGYEDRMDRWVSSGLWQD